MSLLDIDRKITHDSLGGIGFVRKDDGTDPRIRFPHYEKHIYSKSGFYKYTATLSTFRNILTILCRSAALYHVRTILETQVGEIQDIDDLNVYLDQTFLEKKLYETIAKEQMK